MSCKPVFEIAKRASIQRVGSWRGEPGLLEQKWEDLMVENYAPNGDSGKREVPSTPECSRSGLSLLWQAYIYSETCGADLWDFALEIDQLFEFGMTINDLRWMVTRGFVEHGQETTVYGDTHRSFRRGEGLTFTNRTSFVFTATGAGFAGKVLNEPVSQ